MHATLVPAMQKVFCHAVESCDKGGASCSGRFCCIRARRCAPEISRLRGGRADGVCAAASSTLVSGCHWKRGEPRRVFSPPADTAKKEGSRKRAPKSPPFRAARQGLVQNMDPFFRGKKTRTVFPALRRLDYHCRTYRACPGDIVTPLPVTPSLLPSLPLCRPPTVCPSLSLAT